MILLFSRVGLALPIGGVHVLLLLLQLHHLDALRLEQFVLLIGVLSQRGLSVIHGLGQQGGERRVDGLHHGDELQMTSFSRLSHRTHIRSRTGSPVRSCTTTRRRWSTPRGPGGERAGKEESVPQSGRRRT